MCAYKIGKYKVNKGRDIIHTYPYFNIKLTGNKYHINFLYKFLRGAL